MRVEYNEHLQFVSVPVVFSEVAEEVLHTFDHIVPFDAFHRFALVEYENENATLVENLNQILVIHSRVVLNQEITSDLLPQIRQLD